MGSDPGILGELNQSCPAVARAIDMISDTVLSIIPWRTSGAQEYPESSRLCTETGTGDVCVRRGAIADDAVTALWAGVEMKQAETFPYRSTSTRRYPPLLIMCLNQASNQVIHGTKSYPQYLSS